jgi:hypothetical protein
MNRNLGAYKWHIMIVVLVLFVCCGGLAVLGGLGNAVTGVAAGTVPQSGSGLTLGPGTPGYPGPSNLEIDPYRLNIVQLNIV